MSPETQTVATAEPQAEQSSGIEQGLADKAEAIKAVNEADKIAGRREVVADASGNLLVGKQLEEEVAYRQEHGGHGSNETAN